MTFDVIAGDRVLLQEALCDESGQPLMSWPKGKPRPEAHEPEFNIELPNRPFGQPRKRISELELKLRRRRQLNHEE